MKQVNIEDLRDLSKEEAERIVEEHSNTKYQTHIVSVYLVVKTDVETGRIASYNHVNSIPMGAVLTSKDE